MLHTGNGVGARPLSEDLPRNEKQQSLLVSLDSQQFPYSSEARFPESVILIRLQFIMNAFNLQDHFRV